ncbi:peptidoglycan-binding domain-containing protein [Cellulomonas fimi]|uniref:peptidoglycan-binding domain-containing protein n=1 Tax=Cellulomonas fimi TaxID=1708 RepID=UPI0012FB6E7E|nr:peptidoglycan-binding protein [Cellulomonas fimi]
MRSRTASGRGATPVWLVLATLLLAPLLVVGGWWFVAATENPTAAAALVKPVIVPVELHDVRAETTVGVRVDDVAGREAAVAVAGTVTGETRPGQELDDGVEVLRVDDHPVRAMVSDAPLWRVLRPGDQGEDVARLQRFLTGLGLYDGRADGRFGSALGRAVARFNADAGRGSTKTDFDPGTVVWVGPDPLEVAEPLVSVGSSVAPGTPIVRGPARPGVVVVAEPQGGIGAVGRFGAAATLSVGHAAVAYVPGSGAISAPEAVDAIRAALAPAVEGTARVTAAEPVTVVMVPASALVQGLDGSLCVYEDPDSAPIAVEPVGGGVGWTHLPATVRIDRVLANPGRALPDSPCTS